MRHTYPFAVATIVVGLAAAPAFALKIAMPGNQSTMQKALAADAVIVGKVTSIEKDTVDIEPFPMQPKSAHIVVNIKIEEALLGGKNVTHIKVVYPKPAEPNAGGGGGAVPQLPQVRLPGRGGFQPMTLAEDQEGTFFLTKHPTEAGYYTIQQGHVPLRSADTNYKDELAKVKATTLAVADPAKALQSEKPELRMQSAISLAYKYRMYPPSNPSGVIEEEALPADVSQLMMKVLLDSDWSKTEAPKLADALGLFPGQYGLPEIIPGEGEELATVRQNAFQAWFKTYGKKFEVKKLVAKTKNSK